MDFSLFVAKVWFISIFLGIVNYIVIKLYNRPFKGLSMKPELRPLNKLLDISLEFLVGVFSVASLILISLILIDYLNSPKLKSVNNFRVENTVKIEDY